MTNGKESKLEDHRKKLTLLGVVGAPFFIALALGSTAYFKGNALLPVLADESTAFKVFLAGAIGALVDIILSAYQIFRIKALENEVT